MGSNQSCPGGSEELQANAADYATEAVGHVEAQHSGSPLSYYLSLAGRQIIGNDGAKLFFPCPISAALTVHHHDDFIAIEVPVHYIVKNAGLFDLVGAQRLLTRFVDAIKQAVVPISSKQIRLANEVEFQIDRFEAGYPREIASMFYGMVRGSLDEYNKANISQVTTTTDTAMEIATEQQSAPTAERSTDSTFVLAKKQIDDPPQHADASTERPSLKRKAPPLVKPTGCDNCGGKHDRTMCTKACRSCGLFHGDREKRCPKESDQCWCENYPRHTNREVRPCRPLDLPLM